MVAALVLGVWWVIAAVDELDATDEWEGNYSLDRVHNSCDSVDSNALERWTPLHKEIMHTESPTHDEFGGGTLSCLIEGTGTNGQTVGLTLDAGLDTAGSGPSFYDEWKKRDTSKTGTEHWHGRLSGLGDQAYFASKEPSESSSTNEFDYTVAVHDSNLTVKIKIKRRRGDTKPIDQGAVARAAQAQALHVLSVLRK